MREKERDENNKQNLKLTPYVCLLKRSPVTEQQLLLPNGDDDDDDTGVEDAASERECVIQVSIELNTSSLYSSWSAHFAAPINSLSLSHGRTHTLSLSLSFSVYVCICLFFRSGDPHPHSPPVSPSFVCPNESSVT